MFNRAIPVLHVSSAAAAEEFYCNLLGFRQTFAYRFDDAKPDPRYIADPDGNSLRFVHGGE